jgi:hypothetical protein
VVIAGLHENGRRKSPPRVICTRHRTLLPYVRNVQTRIQGLWRITVDRYEAHVRARFTAPVLVVVGARTSFRHLCQPAARREVRPRKVENALLVLSYFADAIPSAHYSPPGGWVSLWGSCTLPTHHMGVQRQTVARGWGCQNAHPVSSVHGYPYITSVHAPQAPK